MSTGITAAGNVMSAPSLSRLMSTSLPRGAEPQIKNAYDAIALASHAALLSVGFRLVGLTEDHKIETQSDTTEPQPLPLEWNANAGTYAFRYKHIQSSMEYLLKVTRMGNKVVVLGMGMGDDKTHSFNVKVTEFISNGNLPASPLKEGTSEDESMKALIDIFISVGRLSDFGSLVRLHIIQKLMPSLQKEGYQETQGERTSSTSASQDRQPHSADRPDENPLRDDRTPRPFPMPDPLAHPRRPIPEPMPGFEDEFETQRPMRGGIPGGVFGRIGDRDLYPQGLGPNDPIHGGIGPGFGGMGGGGMHPTFEDPLFARQDQGGHGYIPPGARYDPVGPGNRGGHPRGAGMGGRPPNPFGGFGDGDFI